MFPDYRFGVRRTLVALVGALGLAGLPGVAAQAHKANPIAAPALVPSQSGRVLVLPEIDYGRDSAPDKGSAQRHGGFAVSSEVRDGRRFYTVLHEGRVQTASVPNDAAAPFRLAYNPGVRRFYRLLSSVRVELRDYGALGRVIRELGALGGKAYPQLGYAVIGLKPEVHPLTAVEALHRHPGVISAQVRLQGPPKRPR